MLFKNSIFNCYICPNEHSFLNISQLVYPEAFHLDNDSLSAPFVGNLSASNGVNGIDMACSESRSFFLVP
jgi:hypothetical protein